MINYKNNIKLDYIYTFIRSFNLTQGIWLIYLAYRGFTLIEIGIFEGIFHISSLSMEVPTGMVADLYGRKLSRILSVLIYILYLLIIILSNNFIIVAFGFFLCGLSYTFESGSGEALIYDSLLKTEDQHKYMKVIGKKEVLFQISSTVALFIGGFIAYKALNLSFILMIIVFVTALIPLFNMTETPQPQQHKDIKLSNLVYEHFVKSTKTVLKNKRVLFLVIIGALMAAPVTTVFFYFQIYLSDLEYSIYFIGLLLGFHALLGSVGAYFAQEIEKRYKEKLILYLIPIFIVFSFWIFQIDEIIFIPFIILGFLESILYVVLSDYINKLIPSEQRATVLSFGSLVFSIIMIILFPVIGYFGEIYSLKFSFMILAFIVSILYFVLLIILRKNGVSRDVT